MMASMSILGKQTCPNWIITDATCFMSEKFQFVLSSDASALFLLLKESCRTMAPQAVLFDRLAL